MESNHTVFKFTTRFFLVILIVYVLIIGKSFLTPLAWAIVIGLASFQFVEKINQKSRIPFGLIIILFLLLLVSVVSLVFYFFYVELSHIVSDLPSINDKISSSLHQVSLSLKDSGVHIPDHIDNQLIHEWVQKNSQAIFGFISGFGEGIGHILLAAVYLFFLLFYGDLVPRFFESKIKDEKKRETLKENIYKSVSIVKSYIIGLLILGLIEAVFVYIILLILGVDYALFFALMLGVLSLIPFIGNPIGLILVGLFTLFTKDSLVTLLLVVGLIWITGVILENVVRPVLMGDRLQINAFVVFMSVIVGGLLWGISGMILFIPFAGIIKVALMYNESTSHYAILLGEKPKKEKRKRSKTGNK
jgi:predicted PurR-regulated permease PerM